MKSDTKSYLVACVMAVPAYVGIFSTVTVLTYEEPNEDYIQITEALSQETYVPGISVTPTVDYVPYVPPYNDLNDRLYNQTAIIPEIRNDDGNREWLLCAAINVYHEARGSTTEDQIAVANVVKNRVDDWRWPDDLCDVVWDDRQFSWTQDGLSDIPREEEAWIKSQYIAYMTLYNYVENPIGEANHYHADYVQPYWSKSQKVKVGSHYYMSY